MTQTRIDIRTNVVDALKAAGLVVGDRVFKNRVRPWQHEELPAITVYTTSEDLERQSEDYHVRKMELVVEAVIDAKEAELDDQLDLLSAAIEAVVWADETLGCCAEDLEQLRVEGPILAEGSPLTGSLRVVFELSYSEERQRSIPPNALLTANVKTDTDQSNADPEAEDQIALPQ